MRLIITKVRPDVKMRQPLPRTRAGVCFFRDGFAQGFPARPKPARAGRAAWYAIAQAARNAQQNQAVEFTGESDQLALNVAYGAAHGTKCFTLAAALTDGENIVLSYLDDLQFMNTADGVTGVPNSDADFGADYAEGKVLGSKRENDAYYYVSRPSAHVGWTGLSF